MHQSRRFYLKCLDYPSKPVISYIWWSSDHFEDLMKIWTTPPFPLQNIYILIKFGRYYLRDYRLLESIHRPQVENLSSINTPCTPNSRNTAARRQGGWWHAALNWKSEVLISCYNLVSQEVFIVARSKPT